MSLQLSDMTAAQAILKQYYDGQLPEDMTYQERPLFALLHKMEEFGGSGYPMPLTYGKGQGRSANFANAQANQSATKRKQFFITDVTDYALATLARKAILQAAGNKESFLNYATGEIDGAIDSCSASISSALYRSGTGTIGAIGTINTGVITLADPEQITQFETDMVLEASATDGGAARAALGYVVGRNAQAGTITVSATFQGAAGTPTAWANGDYLTVQGDRNAKLSGLQAWLPAVAPTSGDSFFGVDRSANSRLYGAYMDVSDRSPEEGLVTVINYLSREGSKADTFVTNFTSYGAMINALGTKVVRTELKGPGNIGFPGIKVMAGKREVTVVPDKDCQGKLGFALQMNTWTLFSTGKAPHLQTENVQGDMLRVSNADAAEARVSFYGQLACSAPGWNAQVKLSV